jgi:pyruvate dehydrogenase E2 component (dihydrolipoamide acetyltransferase)
MTERIYDHAEKARIAVEGRVTELCVACFRTRPDDSRPKVLLLHGNPTNMGDWDELLPFLREHATVAALDLPGFGGSERVSPGEKQSLLDAFAECVVAVLDRLGFRNFVYLVGHSHGAAVAQVVAARYPERVSGLVLIASLGVPAHAAYRQLALPGMSSVMRPIAALMGADRHRSAKRSLLRAVMRPMFRPATLSEDRVEAQLDAFETRPDVLSAMVLCARGGPSAQLARDAKRVHVPVLFIHGDSDGLVPGRNAAALCTLLSAHVRAVFRVVAGGGHMIHVTHAAAVAELAVEWIVAAHGVRATGVNR